VFDLAAYGVVPLGPVPGGLPDIGIPDVSWTSGTVAQLVTTSIVMFVVILAQSAATSCAYAAKYEEHFDENADLIGLSLANVAAGLSGTFVVNGSPTKTVRFTAGRQDRTFTAGSFWHTRRARACDCQARRIRKWLSSG
jgi:SulP family sulfate permease